VYYGSHQQHKTAVLKTPLQQAYSSDAINTSSLSNHVCNDDSIALFNGIVGHVKYLSY
jgi:hypothetical protein